MTTATPRSPVVEPPPVQSRRRPPVATTAVGGFYLAMGGIHVGIVAADAQTYRHFADAAILGFVRTGWSDVFMADPAVWGLLLAVGELTLGVLLLVGGRAARVGWVGVMAFHVLLLLFGWGFWLWSLPVLAVLQLGARRDWAQLGRRDPVPVGRPHGRRNEHAAPQSGAEGGPLDVSDQRLG